jgi:hypothetical protein
MRNLLHTVITSFALATLIAGSAAAADRLHSPGDQTDLGQSWLDRAPAGQIVSQSEPGLDRTQPSVIDQTDQGKAWLYRSPAGVIVSQSEPSPDRTQSAAVDETEVNKSWLERSPLGTVVSPGSNTEAAEMR